jgi:hypothetical protein
MKETDMGIRFGAIGAVLLAFGVVCSATSPDRPPQDKNSIKALFDEIPKDLAAKVKDNPVRCDRVNDWLQEHVNGKGKTIEIRVEMKEVRPYRKEGAYLVYLTLAAPKLNFLGDDWRVHIGDGVSPGRASANFTFEGVSTADAEKLVDLTHVSIQGKVKEVNLPRFSARFSKPAAPLDPELRIVLEDVQVDGKKWTPYKGPIIGGGFGNGGFGGGNPFGGAGGGIPFDEEDGPMPDVGGGSRKKGGKSRD